jgi:arylsulfatase A-like enzyme
MKPDVDRREFLKLAGLTSLSYAIPHWLVAPATEPQSTQGKNILLIVFDALSANNISFYGYDRGTMPNLAELASRAIVYHNHYAGGPFTTPGTASLLTGALPWTHRAFVHDGMVSESFVNRSIFHTFPDYYRISYSHNPLVNTLLKQFKQDLLEYIPRQRLFLTNDGFIQSLFGKDEDIATVSWTRTLKREDWGYVYSLFLSRIYEQIQDSTVADLKPFYPRGLPRISSDNYFILEQAVDLIMGRLGAVPQPFMGYFHFLPPHYPYKTHRDFYGRFARDGWKPPKKPVDPSFTQEKSPETLLEWRTWYDEFILYADREFGRLFEFLEESGLLENTWVIFTADHGEMFERGISGHLTHALYQPVMRIPLLIFEPGRRTRTDVYTPTSAIDMMPTLLQVSGKEIPNWVEGVVLPPFAQKSPDLDRKLFAMNLRDSHPDAPLDIASLMLLKGKFKLTYYYGYGRLQEGDERVDLYDVETDPQELDNLYPAQRGIGADLLDELKVKLAEVNAPYL